MSSSGCSISFCCEAIEIIALALKTWWKLLSAGTVLAEGHVSPSLADLMSLLEFHRQNVAELFVRDRRWRRRYGIGPADAGNCGLVERGIAGSLVNANGQDMAQSVDYKAHRDNLDLVLSILRITHMRLKISAKLRLPCRPQPLSVFADSDTWEPSQRSPLAGILSRALLRGRGFQFRRGRGFHRCHFRVVLLGLGSVSPPGRDRRFRSVRPSAARFP